MSAAQGTDRTSGRRADVEAALLLERMGLTAADLAAAGSPRREVPTTCRSAPKGHQGSSGRITFP